MSMRSNLQKAIYIVINPVVRFFIKAGLTPNAVTITGLLLNIGVSIIFVRGAEEGNRGDLSYVGWAGALVLFAGLFDMLDGQVARLGNMGTTFGALFDSVLDRYSELILFLGICYYLVSHHYFFSSLFAFIALIGSMMVSYVRARAEGLGIECKGGLMQRPERVVTIGVSALACGILSKWMGGDYKLFVPGISFHVFETMSIFTIPITVMAVLTNLTAVRRLNDCRIAMRGSIKPRARVASSGKLQAWFIVLIMGTACTAFAQQKQVADDDTFPVPLHMPNHLFYLQRTPDANTIICELNYKNGVIDKEEPVHVFWIRYTEQQQKKELSALQRNFAYGIKSRQLGNGKYELHFAGYKNLLFYLEPSADKKYGVYATIAGKKAILHRIFIKINGGSFRSPNVEYIELKGTDPHGGHDLLERIKV